MDQDYMFSHKPGSLCVFTLVATFVSVWLPFHAIAIKANTPNQFWTVDQHTLSHNMYILSTALQREILRLSRRRREECDEQVGLFAGQLQMGPTQVQLWQPGTGKFSETFLLIKWSIRLYFTTSSSLLYVRRWCLCLFWPQKTAGSI